MAEQTSTPANQEPQQQQSSQAAPKPNPNYVAPAKTPVYKALKGVYFDFNHGARVVVTEEADKAYRIVILDADSMATLYSGVLNKGGIVRTNKTYYTRYRLLIYDPDDKSGKPIFDHLMNLKGMPVLVQLSGTAIGDNIGWFSYIERFQQKFGADVHVYMAQHVAELFKKQYPSIKFLTKEETQAFTQKAYASYWLGLFFKNNTNQQPYDFRYVGLHKTAGYILGLRTQEELADIPPRVDLSAKRTIKGKYAVIAVQASSKAKQWNNPGGWRKVVKQLTDNGYRVLCIDKAAEQCFELSSNCIPHGCEDFTGDIPLQERINIIKDADVFIGMSSGLAWLAWCCKVPVVLISGFTDPYNEFYTPYRVQNTQVCHGCWHGLQDEFSHTDYFWCPRKEKNSEKFECTRMITPVMVLHAVNAALQSKKAKSKRK